MTKPFIFIGALAAALIGAPAQAAPLKVVATTQDLESLAKEVGGDKVETESLAKGYQDPHKVEPKPSFILKLNKADLLIVVGRELEIGWLPALINQARNPRIQPGADRYLDASGFAQRYADFDKRLADAEKRWNAAMAPYKGTKIVTYHRSWPNFVEAYGLDV